MTLTRMFKQHAKDYFTGAICYVSDRPASRCLNPTSKQKPPLKLHNIIFSILQHLNEVNACASTSHWPKFQPSDCIKYLASYSIWPFNPTILTPYHMNQIKHIVCRGSLRGKIHALILQGKTGD